MAAAAASLTTTTATIARGGSIHSSLGTLAPINTPTPRLDGKSEESEQQQQPGVSDPNVYIVQPFKQASLPKDLIYARKNPPNPAQGLLNSTIDLINHFTSCYEALKHQLHEKKGQGGEKGTSSRVASAVGSSYFNNSRSGFCRLAKQARLKPLILHRGQKGREVVEGPDIGNCVGILPLPVTKVNDLAHIYDEKLRLLRKLKPEFFDAQGNLLSYSNNQLSHSESHASARSSKKSATSSFRTPHNTLRSGENVQFDDRRTFLTEFTSEEEDDGEKAEQQKTSTGTFVSQPTNPANEFMKKNYVIKVVEIKTMTTSKQNRTRSAAEKSANFIRKGASTAKSS